MKNPERVRLAEILKNLQEEKGFRSAAELAKAIDIPAQRFRSYMRAQNSAQIESLTKIESYMGLREGELWDMLYKDESEVKSASELILLFRKLSHPEKKKFLQLAMDII